MTSRRRRPYPLLLAAVLVAGCGSTVATQSQNRPDGGSAEPLDAPGATSELGVGSDPGDPGAPGGVGEALSPGSGGVPDDGSTRQGADGGRSDGPGPASSGSGAGGSGGSGGTTAPSRTAPSAPGVTATTITIGLTYASNTEARGAALGVDVETGDPLAQQRVFVNDINKRGGILGRKLVVVEHAVDATSTDTYSAQAQQQCSKFTEDNKVFAVLEGGLDDTLRACVHKAGGVQVEVSAQSFVDARTFQRFPYYIEPAGIGQDRIAAAWTPALRAQSYFSPWDFNTGRPGAMPVKVGVLLLDDPADVYAYEKFLEPAIKAAGYPVQSFRASSPQSPSDGRSISEIQSAVLQFRTDGVTHFLPLDSGAGLALTFATNANSQRYYPRYGLNSAAGVQVLIDQAAFPKEQLNGALGYGWSGFLDVSAAENADDGPNSNAMRRFCLKLLKDNGQEVSGTAAKRGAAEQCTKIYFLKAALEAGGPTISRASFLAGVNALRGGFEAANTFRTYLDPTHHAGVAAMRLFGYDNPCGCFRYTSPLRPL